MVGLESRRFFYQIAGLSWPELVLGVGGCLGSLLRGEEVVPWVSGQLSSWCDLCQPWQLFPVLWSTVQVCHQEHSKNTCDGAGNAPLLSVQPQSQRNGEGTGADLGNHCATEVVVFN